MNKLVIATTAALLALGSWQLWSSPTPIFAAHGTSDRPDANSVRAAGLSVSPVDHSMATASAAASGIPGGVVELAPLQSYQLTRVLEGEQKVHFDGREQRVLGTREITDEYGRQTLLVTRDEVSGTLSYWQSGLRFALKHGQDYEGFIRENLRFRRQFVNQQYAEVALDAGDIAAAYRQLSGDDRVAGVQLLPLQRRNKLK